MEASITGTRVTSLQVAGAVAGGGLGAAAGTRVGVAATAHMQSSAARPGIDEHIGAATEAAVRLGGRLVIHLPLLVRKLA